MNKLSADPAVLVLGIISIAIIFFGFCCGPFVVVSLILGIIGLVMANRSLKEFAGHPEDFNHKSRSNVYTGKVLCIISTALSGLMILVFAIYVAVFGKEILHKALGKYYHIKELQHQMRDNIKNDTIYHKNESKDSIAIDTVAVEPVKTK